MRKKPLIALAIFFVLLLGIFVFRFVKFNPVYQLVFDKDIALQKTEEQERVNILLLGIGGGRHDGPNLTDTIIFTSVDPQQQKVTLVSIPRDLWSPDLQAKVNTAYAFGEEKQKGGGITLARKTISEVVGQPIHYVIRIDFNGFVKAVDLLGGLEIDVERSFDDYAYPISGEENNTCGKEGEEFEKAATASSQLEAFPCRYMHVHFEKGLQHMDGETALIYVRSRHALGPEGTDFSRSKRQAKVINAFKDKVFSLGTILNPAKMVSLYTVLQSSIDTDIKEEEFDDFVKLAQKMQGAKIESVVIDEGDYTSGREGLLASPGVSPEFRGQWALAPKAGSEDFSEIHAYVSCQIGTGPCPSPTPGPLSPTVAAQQPLQ